jgi:O-antigen/teichoic acid export membrane protein
MGLQLRGLLRRIGKSRFARSVAVLAGGMALARAIPILTGPVITRLYTPADLGVFALFTALVGSMAPAICGRYEVATLLPQEDSDGLHLVGVSMTVALCVSGLATGVLLVFKEPILAAMNADELGLWLFVVPVALVAHGTMVALMHLSNRTEDYRGMAGATTLNAVLVAVVSVGLGALGAGVTGLILGMIIGALAAACRLMYAMRHILSPSLLSWGERKSKLAWRYRDYPLYNASGALLNGFAASMPIFFLSGFFPGAIVGLYAVGTRAVLLPIGFLSASISQVTLKKVVDLVNEGEDVRPFLMKLTVALAALITIPTIVVVGGAPELFSLVFGEEWATAGVYVQVLMPAVAVSFVVSTVSTTLGATQNNRIGAAWMAIAFAVKLSVLTIYAPRGEILDLLRAMMVADLGLYLVYFAMIWWGAGHPKNGDVQYDA